MVDTYLPTYLPIYLPTLLKFIHHPFDCLSCISLVPPPSPGTAGPYHQRKRSLMEGGIRVPLIVQWVGKVPAGQTMALWAATVDLLPTFLGIQ